MQANDQVRELSEIEIDHVEGGSNALPQPQPPGLFPSGNPNFAPGASNDPGNSSH